MPDGKKITFNQTYVCCFSNGLGFFKTDSIVDPAGRTVTYTYETDPLSSYPRLKKVTYPDGSTIEYQYDSSGRMSGDINELGVLEVLNEYDSNNRVIRQTHSDGGTYTFNYTVAGGFVTETSMTAPNGAITTWRFYDDSGAYRNGYITKVITPDGTTTYEREPGTNRILSITDPLGRKMTYTYDTKGRVVTLTDNAGNVTRYEYEDTFSKVTKITDAIGNITTMTYDTKGNMLTTTGPDGKTTTFTYNTMGKPLSITDALGNTTTMEYDTSGNLTKVTDPLGNSSQMAYDRLGRLITMTDANGKSTLYNYDVMGRISYVTDPLGNVTRYYYTNGGKLTQVIDAKKHDISYDYDSRGRLIKMTDQLGRVETYEYDTSDNLIKLTDRKGQVTTYTYDSMNRLTKATYADGSYTNYTYDTIGRLISVSDSVSGTITYTYTDTGCGTGCGSIPDKIASETTPLGTINYTYDKIGRRMSMTVSGQPAVSYSYDANSRLTKVSRDINGTVKDFSISYDGAGRRTSLQVPLYKSKGKWQYLTTNYAYDVASRLLNIKHLNPTATIEDLLYEYDPNGNRTKMNRSSVSLPLRDGVTNTSYNEANQMLTWRLKKTAYPICSVIPDVQKSIPTSRGITEPYRKSL